MSEADPTPTPIPHGVAVPEGGSVLSSPWFWLPVSLAVVAAVVLVLTPWSIRNSTTAR